MKKTIHIEGMMCQHCAAHVADALNKIPGLQASVDLASETASVESSLPISDDMLTKCITAAGYTVKEISE